MPRWAQSIRFRLSVAYALAIFTAGATLLLVLYLWQVRQLDEPILVRTEPIVFTDPRTGEQWPTPFRALTDDAVTDALMERIERDAYRRSLEQLRQASMTGLGFLVIVAFGSGWFLAGWTLKPIRRMNDVAREVSGADLSGRIDLNGPDDELKGLADTFDAMLDRLQSSFEEQRRFVQDASHELRNPLAVARTNLEVALDDPDASVDDLRRAAGIAHSASDRMSRIVDDLVEQARSQLPQATIGMVDLTATARSVAAELAAGAKARKLTITVSPQIIPSPVDNLVGDVVHRLVERPVDSPRVGAAATERARRLTRGGITPRGGDVRGEATAVVDERVDGPDPTTERGGHSGGPAAVGDAVVVRGDPTALRRALTNLVVNAVRLAPEGTTILITTRATADEAEVCVIDEGPGIAPEDVQRVFDRFWRGPDAGPGLGLGLSIVRQVAERHGGRVEVSTNERGKGSTFTLTLPRPTGTPAVSP
ncbi:MAG: sensor histidine kinase [Acidimicrobiales bacterium]